MNVGIYFQTVGLALALCGLFVLVMWIIRRLRGWAPKGGQDLIKIKAFRALTHKSQLVLIEVEGKLLLLGVGDTGPRLLWEFKGEEK